MTRIAINILVWFKVHLAYMDNNCCPGEGYFLIRALWGRAASQRMFFGIFVLNRVLILSIFVLNRVSFLRQEPITLFLDDKQLAVMFYECLKLGIKNWNSVLNRVGKSAIFVLNRVRV